jgi:hypothetical protein
VSPDPAIANAPTKAPSKVTSRTRRKKAQITKPATKRGSSNPTWSVIWSGVEETSPTLRAARARSVPERTLWPVLTQGRNVATTTMRPPKTVTVRALSIMDVASLASIGGFRPAVELREATGYDFNKLLKNGGSWCNRYSSTRLRVTAKG